MPAPLGGWLSFALCAPQRRQRTDASQRASQNASYHGARGLLVCGGGGGGGVYAGRFGVGKPHWLPLVTSFS